MCKTTTTPPISDESKTIIGTSELSCDSAKTGAANFQRPKVLPPIQLVATHYFGLVLQQ